MHRPDPLGFDARGELVLRFTYRPDPEKTGQDAGWREKRNAEAVQVLLAQLQALAPGDARAAAYLQALLRPASTEKDPKRPLLAKYINQYTARNTMDYFIHKDLGGFLRRELDFYIKNEVMRLDDIAGADAVRAEQYLVQVRVLRAIAGKLIAFLAQLENFQKKLWLKKKFVVETHYCITLDRILAIEDAAERDWLLQQIAANDAQREEWVRLFAIDEIGESTVGAGYSVPLTMEFLKYNQNLVLDTVFFSSDFKARVVNSENYLDDTVGGTLFQSDNFQALGLLASRLHRSVECFYIDPPYNTSENSFIYKNAYKDSSWITMMHNRCSVARNCLSVGGVLQVAIDDTETANLRSILDSLFGSENRTATFAVEVNPAGQNLRPNSPALSHDYCHIYANDIDSMEMRLRSLTDEEVKAFKETDKKGRFLWDNLRRRGGNSRPKDRPGQWFPLYIDGPSGKVSTKPFPGAVEVWPIDPQGEQRIWRVNPAGAEREIEAGEVSVLEKAGRWEVVKKTRIPEGKKPKTLWADSKYSATTYGTKLLIDILGEQRFSYPKSIHLVTDCIRYWADKSSTIVDFFAGSGTTGHAAITLNLEDEGDRKFVLIEANNYFDDVLKPRIIKVIYSQEWLRGKPVIRESPVSIAIKYLRLESYEDCLNNLEFQDDAERQAALDANPQLAEEHLLHYMLDVETAGSASLLNLDSFADPAAYRLKVKLPGSDAYAWRTVDLLETFNYLLGLRVQHIAAPQTFTAAFVRPPDPELPQDGHTRLQIVSGSFRPDPAGPWCIRTVEGWLPQDADQPQAAQVDPNRRRRILVVWRKLTGDLEQDNLVLDEWFRRHHINPRDREYDTIYVNGSNNLPNLRGPDDLWKVRLIEEDFLRLMWDTEGN